jgi:hypothetical protein
MGRVSTGVVRSYARLGACRSVKINFRTLQARARHRPGPAVAATVALAPQGFLGARRLSLLKKSWGRGAAVILMGWRTSRRRGVDGRRCSGRTSRQGQSGVGGCAPSEGRRLNRRSSNGLRSSTFVSVVEAAEMPESRRSGRRPAPRRIVKRACPCATRNGSETSESTQAERPGRGAARVHW